MYCGGDFYAQCAECRPGVERHRRRMPACESLENDLNVLGLLLPRNGAAGTIYHCSKQMQKHATALYSTISSTTISTTFRHSDTMDAISRVRVCLCTCVLYIQCKHAIVIACACAFVFLCACFFFLRLSLSSWCCAFARAIVQYVRVPRVLHADYSYVLLVVIFLG